MNPRIQKLCAALLAWNISFGILWIGLSETGAVNRASNAHGQVEDTEKRIALMKQHMEAELAEGRPYYPMIMALTGINVVLAIMILIASPVERPAQTVPLVARETHQAQ